MAPKTIYRKARSSNPGDGDFIGTPAVFEVQQRLGIAKIIIVAEGRAEV